MSEHTNRVDEESAIAEFERFGEAMELDFDITKMDVEEVENFQQLKRRFVKAVMDGRLVVNDEGEPVLSYTDTTGEPQKLTFREPSGATIQEMDKVKKGDIAKMHMVLKSMCQVAPAVFSKMKMRHHKVVQAIVTLFMS